MASVTQVTGGVEKNVDDRGKRLACKKAHVACALSIVLKVWGEIALPVGLYSRGK